MSKNQNARNSMFQVESLMISQVHMFIEGYIKIVKGTWLCHSDFKYIARFHCEGLVTNHSILIITKYVSKIPKFDVK